MPTFKNDYKFWSKHYAKAKVDFEYLISTHLPSDIQAVIKNENNIQISKKSSLKIEAEKIFKHNEEFVCEDEMSNWLT